MKKFAMFCAALLIASAGLGEELSEAEITARDEAFSKSMTKCVLVGSFTVDGKESEGAPKAERYEIESRHKITDHSPDRMGRRYTSGFTHKREPAGTGRWFFSSSHVP